MSKLVLQTAATDVPVSSAEAAAWLRETDSSRDAVIADLVDSAVEILQKEHWTQFCTATFDQYFDDWPSSFFLLRKHPVITVSSVKYIDLDGTEQTVSTDTWEQADEHGRGIVRLKYDQDWPSDLRGHPDDIVIRYTSGYGSSASVPVPIKHALRMWVAGAYAFPDPVSTLRLERVPITVESLMAPYSYRTIG